jgi:hypothetical protein
MKNKHFDHELISDVLKKYKKDYVPKYLKQWIQIGTMNQNVFSLSNDYPFIAFGKVTVWIGGYENSSSQPFVLQVLLMDNMEKIKIKVTEREPFTNIQLKSFIKTENVKMNQTVWNEGATLKAEDTIMSSRLYQDNRVIMAKIVKEKVTDRLLFFV